jgi:hypothetical protein
MKSAVLKALTQSLLIILALLCFARLSKVQAVVPPPDGGYPGFNTAEGQNALFTLTTGAANTAVGWHSLFSAGAANNNTGVGAGTLALNTSESNTAVGAAALFLNTSGDQNTAVGTAALLFNDSGSHNNAIGVDALITTLTETSTPLLAVPRFLQIFTALRTLPLVMKRSRVMTRLETGLGTSIRQLALRRSFLTLMAIQTPPPALARSKIMTSATSTPANGGFALFFNTTGSHNTAVGDSALYHNDTGGGNVALGDSALFNNQNGNFNTAVGNLALSSNTSGSVNVAVGANALHDNTNGDSNTAVGTGALFSLGMGTNNVALGKDAGINLTTGSSNVYIDNTGVASESQTIRIGASQTATYVAGISGQTASGGVAVFVNSDGKLGTSTSSKLFKEDIQPMDNASEGVFALKPVTFRYKKELDPSSLPQFGLVAEDVEKVNPDLVARDRDGKPYTVRYEAVNAMLLNEFLKEHRKVAEQQATIAQLKKEIEAILAHSKEQDLEIQRVRDQVQISRSAAQLAAIDQ